MDEHEAKRCIMLHSGYLESKVDDGLLGSLRHYSGLNSCAFLEIMDALIVLADKLRSNSRIHRTLVPAIWDMCSTARHWGTRPDGMLMRNGLILPNDVSRLQKWTDIIEETTLHLLAGRDTCYAFHGFMGYLAESDVTVVDLELLLPMLISALKHEDEDVRIPACLAIGEVGDSSVIPALQHTLEDRSEEVRSAAGNALERLRRR